MRKALASGLRSLASASASNTDDAPEPQDPATDDAEEPVFVGNGHPDFPEATCAEGASKEKEPKRGKANDCCALCTESFTPWGSSLNLGSLVRKAPPRRNKHLCRVCARPVCESDSADVQGCCSKARVPKRLWHRSLASLRKEDTKVPRRDCAVCIRSKDAGPAPEDEGREDAEGTPGEGEKTSGSASPSAPDVCSCAEGWLCIDCEHQVRESATSTVIDDLQQAAEDGNSDELQRLAEDPLILWLLTLDCDDSDDAQHFAGLSQRFLRLASYLDSGFKPDWPRPAAKPRCYKSQVGYSALEAINFVAGGKIRLAVKGVRLAARGYAFSEYILSEEFVVAWRLLLEQLGEFVDAPSPTGSMSPPPEGSAAASASAEASPPQEPESGAQQLGASTQMAASYTAQAVATKQRAAVAFDLCKRFYYYSLHLTLERLKLAQEAPPSLPPQRGCSELPVDKDGSPASSPERKTDQRQGGDSEEVVAKILDEACEYLHMTALLYDSSEAAERRPSMDAGAEAAWFLNRSLSDDGFVLLDYVPEAGEDRRQRSTTFGAKHPAFAVLVNRQRKVLVVAVRGSKGKQDHLIDIDFQYDRLIPRKPAASPSMAADCSRPVQSAGGAAQKEGLNESEEEWTGGHVHRGMLKCARFILQTRGLRALLCKVPADYKIRLVGHSLGAGTVALLVAILKADSQFSAYDIRAHGFGMPACVSPELSQKLKPFVTSVVHREDMVPRLSFSNLLRLRTHFNRPEEKEWCSKQIDIDYENFWSYVGWTADEKKQREMREAEELAAAQEEAEAQAAASPPAGAPSAKRREDSWVAAAGPAATGVAGCSPSKTAGGESGFRNILGDLVVPGQVIHLREESETGCYKACLAEFDDPELQWIKVQLRAIDDHYIKRQVHFGAGDVICLCLTHA